MKTICYALTAALMYIIICTGFGCGKDHSEPQKHFRIKSSTNYYNGTLESKMNLVYEGEKLITMKGYSVSGQGVTTEDDRIGFEYAGENQATGISYVFEGGNWLQESKAEITFDGDHATNIKFSEWTNGNWVPDNKVSRFIEGGILTRIEKLVFNGSWQNETRQVFEYSGGKLTLVTTFSWTNNNWESVYKHEITYNGLHYNTITGYVTSPPSWKMDSKYVYQYVNDKISLIDYYSVFNDTLTSIYNSAYTYDSDGNLTQESTTIDFMGYTSTSKNVYEYEEAKGNWTKLTEALYGESWFYQSIVPNPTKSMGSATGKPVNWKFPLIHRNKL